jgi:hypothetical protein
VPRQASGQRQGRASVFLIVIPSVTQQFSCRDVDGWGGMRPLVFVTALEGFRPDQPQRGPSFASCAQVGSQASGKSRRKNSAFIC